MKNLLLYNQYNTDIAELSDASLFCVSPDLNAVIVFNDSRLYTVSTRNGNVELLYDVHEYFCTDVPSIIHMSAHSIIDTLCLAFQNGDILTLDPNSREVECVGCVGNGLRAVQWSPDQEVVAMVTGQDTVLLMTGTFDPIIEVDLQQKNFGEKEFVTVGWGKKETQFHGSEGKAAAQARAKLDEKVTVLDDGDPLISWRGDGALFAVSLTKIEFHTRQMYIFSREGILQYTSEHAIGLEGALSWRPSGNIIAVSQRLPNRHVIAFFEKNGLRHGEFTLPFSQNECKINHLAWNSESTILAVFGEYINGGNFLQLWTVNNYHWYLKQNLRFLKEKKLLAIEWDEQHGNRLHLLCEGLSYSFYEWNWAVSHTNGKGQDDGAFVSVIDGDKILLTSIRHSIVPPPLCSQTLQVSSPVSSVVFAPPLTEVLESSNIGCNDLCAILSNGTIGIFKYSPSEKKHSQTVVCSLEKGNAAHLHHWLWVKEDTLLCCRTLGTATFIVELSLDLKLGKVISRKEISAGGIVLSLLLSSNKSQVFVQLNDGALFVYKLEQSEIVPLNKSLPEGCETLEVCEIDGKDVILGLSIRSRLYVDGQEVANNVTSLVVHSEFILFTTLKHTLLSVRISKKGLQTLLEGKIGPGRRIERGARLIRSVPGDTRVVLQMPRGNLECIQPRPLTLHVASIHLNSKQYGAAFELLRKQRINLNLLCDHQPQVFLANLNFFVAELKDPSWICLFLSELQDENVTHTMYKEYYDHDGHLPDTLSNKVHVICDAIREAMTKLDVDKYLLPILTSYVKKQTDKDLADALLKVKAVKEAEKKNLHPIVSADEALKYLLYMVDVNRLYEVALGLYDFDLVMLVAAKSNKDPKEYIPFLNDLRRMTPNYSYFVIDKHLRRYESALKNIALCTEDDTFKECLNFIKGHNLYSQALKLFPKGSSRYVDVASIYADHLVEKRQYQEAGLMYTRAENHQKALAAYLQAGDWRETLLAAKYLKYEENKFHELCHDIVARLKIRRQFKEAAELLLQHVGDTEEGIAVLVQGKLWDDAMWVSSLFGRKDLIETHVKPGVEDHLDQLTAQFNSAQEQFSTYKTRLHAVRVAKEKSKLEENDDYLPEECDLYSDTSSVMASSVSASHTGSRASGRSTRSSKNRRKLERKMLSLKEGSPYEEFALIRILHQLISNVFNSTEEVNSLCRALLRFDKDTEATALQNLLSTLVRAMESAKQEIWTPELMQTTQTGYGPNETVNSITAKVSVGGLLNPGLALLEPQFRFPPSKSSSSWQISILNTV